MFQNNTLDSPKRWLDAGYRVFPCQEKKPLVEWKTENKKIFYDGNAVGLYLQGVTDFDVDNPTAHTTRTLPVPPARRSRTPTKA